MEEPLAKIVKTVTPDRERPFYLEASPRSPWRRKIEPWMASPILFGGLIYLGGGFLFRRIFGVSDLDAKNTAALLALLGMIVSCLVALRIERRKRRARNRSQ